MLVKRTLILSLFILPTVVSAQGETFQADSAYATIHYLSVIVGPRPMGSLEEGVALQWFAERLCSYGADTAYVMQVTLMKGGNLSDNSTTGNAVGIFRGETDSTIVVGGHIDSADWGLPGANDNASGVAATLELARLWSNRQRHYTMVFVAFGGEEKGLIGSKYFADRYHVIEDVVLMISLDMGGYGDYIETIFETRSYQAPKWLIKDAFVADRDLDLHLLHYPTHFESIESSSGGTGSDHMSFLDKKIPAIDFTTGINTSPIHTPMDRIEFISREMLHNYGTLVDALLQKYQVTGIPVTANARFLLWSPLGFQIYIPLWLITLIAVCSLAIGIGAFVYSRTHRLHIPREQRIRLSGLKLFFMLIVVCTFLQFGESLMQILKGLRYPWYAHVSAYVPLACLWALAGVWVASQLTRKWKFSPDPYVYAKRALIILAIFIVPLLLVSARIALYPALAMLLFSLAVGIPMPMVRTLLCLLAPIPLLRLLYMEEFPFFIRAFQMAGFEIDTFAESLGFAAAVTLLLVVWFLPMLYVLSFPFVKVPFARTAVKTFRRPYTMIVIALAIIGYSLYLYIIPSYNEMWRPAFSLTARYDMQKKEGKVTLLGNEFFKDVRVEADSLRREYRGRIHKEELPLQFQADWISLHGDETVKIGDEDTVTVNWVLSTARPWFRTSITLTVDTLAVGAVESDLNFSRKSGSLTFSWSADPPAEIRLAARFSLHPKAKLVRRVTASYHEMPFPIAAESELATIRYRTTVVYTDTLTLPRVPAQGDADHLYETIVPAASRPALGVRPAGSSGGNDRSMPVEVKNTRVEK